MAPIGLITALLLVIAQSAVAQYLKYRGPKDMESAIEASRVRFNFFYQESKFN